MKIVIGYKKENYTFIAKKEFNFKTYHIKSKSSFLNFDMCIVPTNKSPYGLCLSYNNILFSALGLFSKYNISDKNISISATHDGYEFCYNNDCENLYTIELGKGFKATQSPINNTSTIQKVDTQLNHLAEKKYIYYENKFEQYFDKIKNREALKFQLDNLIKACFDINSYSINLEDDDVYEFLCLFMQKENNDSYIKENANFKDFLIKYKNKFPESVSIDTAQKVFVDNFNSYILASKESFFDDIFYEAMPTKNNALSYFYNDIFKKLCMSEKKQEEKRIKQKHLNNLKNDHKFLDGIIDKKEFKNCLYDFLHSCHFLNESEFEKSFLKFLNDYQQFEKYCSSIKEFFGSDEIIVNITEELEEKFYKHENNTIELTQEEKYYYLIFSDLKNNLHDLIYIKNSTNLKPTFNNLPKFIVWATEFFKHLIDKNIIEETGVKINKDNLLLLKDIPKRIFSYNDYASFYKINRYEGLVPPRHPKEIL